MKIGIIDSGVGGLTVLKEMLNLLPNNEYYYCGDTARVPYGTKSSQNIKDHSSKMVEFLLEKEVDLIIVACNSICATCLDQLQKTYRIPFIGVIDPTIEYLVENNIKMTAVIGTEATINSETYEKKLKEHDIYSINRECSLLVDIVERGIPINSSVAVATIDLYLRGFFTYPIRHLILGCTHFPIFESQIQKQFEFIELINPSYLAAKAATKVCSNESNQKIEFYFSDVTPKVFDRIKEILGFSPDAVYVYDFALFQKEDPTKLVLNHVVNQ